jgi:hypothetical protein
MKVKVKVSSEQKTWQWKNQQCISVQPSGSRQPQSGVQLSLSPFVFQILSLGTSGQSDSVLQHQDLPGDVFIKKWTLLCPKPNHPPGESLLMCRKVQTSSHSPVFGSCVCSFWAVLPRTRAEEDLQPGRDSAFQQKSLGLWHLEKLDKDSLGVFYIQWDHLQVSWPLVQRRGSETAS